MSDQQPEPREGLSLGKPEVPGGWIAPDAGRQPAPSDGGHIPPTPTPYAPYNPYAGYAPKPMHERTSPLALAGFITSLGSALLLLTFILGSIGFFGAVTALVLSIIGLARDVNGRRMRGKGFAIAGIAISAALLVLTVLVVVLFIAYVAAHPSAGDTCGYGRACYDYTPGTSI